MMTNLNGLLKTLLKNTRGAKLVSRLILVTIVGEGDSRKLLVVAGKEADEAEIRRELHRIFADNALEDSKIIFQKSEGLVPLQAAYCPPYAGPPAPGIQIGFSLEAPFPATAIGTLGAFVIDGKNKVYALSANHVMIMNGWARNKPSVDLTSDPTPIFVNPLHYSADPNPLALLSSFDSLQGGGRSAYRNEHECALAEVTQEMLPKIDHRFPCEMGMIQSYPRKAKHGDPVKIYTRRCGEVRYGTVCLPAPNYMRFEFGRFGFFSQLLIIGDRAESKLFAEKGDSGSLVFFDKPGHHDDGKPIGMLYAGSPVDQYMPLYLACPLTNFFRDHDLRVLTNDQTLRGKQACRREPSRVKKTARLQRPATR